MERKDISEAYNRFLYALAGGPLEREKLDEPLEKQDVYNVFGEIGDAKGNVGVESFRGSGAPRVLMELYLEVDEEMPYSWNELGLENLAEKAYMDPERVEEALDSLEGRDIIESSEDSYRLKEESQEYFHAMNYVLEVFEELEDKEKEKEVVEEERGKADEETEEYKSENRGERLTDGDATLEEMAEDLDSDLSEWA